MVSAGSGVSAPARHVLSIPLTSAKFAFFLPLSGRIRAEPLLEARPCWLSGGALDNYSGALFGRVGTVSV